MRTPKKTRLLAFLSALTLVLGAGTSQAQEATQGAPFTVDGKVALASLVALADGYLVKLADSLQLLAASPEAQSADWQKIREPLARAGQANVAALNWFALPNGAYWSVQEGKAKGSLATRAYWPKLLAGKTVIGDLVVSKATGKGTAIVAVPVMRGQAVVGILGSSVYLDRLSTRLEREMDLDNTMIFYSFDGQPLKGLNWDPDLIFLDPARLLGQEDFSRAVQDMMTKTHGSESYVFRGVPRTVLFRRSTVTGWWYVFGVVPEGREQKGHLEQRE